MNKGTWNRFGYPNNDTELTVAPVAYIYIYTCMIVRRLVYSLWRTVATSPPPISTCFVMYVEEFCPPLQMRKFSVHLDSYIRWWGRKRWSFWSAFDSIQIHVFVISRICISKYMFQVRDMIAGGVSGKFPGDLLEISVCIGTTPTHMANHTSRVGSPSVQKNDIVTRQLKSFWHDLHEMNSIRTWSYWIYPCWILILASKEWKINILYSNSTYQKG